MLPIRTILHPTDFSESAHHAFELACALARDYRAALVLVHVVPRSPALGPDGSAGTFPEGEEYAGRTRLARLEPTDPTVATERHVLTGDPAEQILKAAHDAKADLIVMGTHGATGLTRLLMGSVAENVTRQASCPVLTARGAFRHAVPDDAVLTPTAPPA